MSKPGKLLICCGPSGSGKSTLVQWLMKEHPELNLKFSISATTRKPRGTEQHGVEYFFLSDEEFRERIERNEFVEYEQVYNGIYYGTLKSQIEEQIENGNNLTFDVDVAGGCRIKRLYGRRALSVFIQPPSVAELRRRLESRGTDSPEAITERVIKAGHELTFVPQFDRVLTNFDLERAKQNLYTMVKEFLSRP